MNHGIMNNFTWKLLYFDFKKKNEKKQTYLEKINK